MLLTLLLACWPDEIRSDNLDRDRDGYEVPQDCDDLDATVNPLAVEVWYDGLDQNCDGANDFDADGDGYEVLEDCDDGDADIHPGAEDAPYDLVDANCDGADEADLDGDGWPWTEDCDDQDPSIHPAAAEVWYDDIDQNCDGADDHDADADGFPAPQDCDDTNPSVFPGAEEFWYDGLDQDCDGADDYDRDGDGSPFDEDCDDEDPSRYPGQVELCDGADQDCDEDIDEDVPGPIAWYLDADGDGFGESLGGSVDSCEELPEGAALVDGDCDGADAEVSPGAEEVCDNGLDDDCDGLAVGCSTLGWLSKSKLVNATGSGGGVALVEGALWYGHGAGVSEHEGASLSGPSGLGSSLAALDADGDGLEDLLVASDEGAFLLFGPVQSQSLSGHDSAVETVLALGDLDGDGLDDFALDEAVVLGGASSTPSPSEAVADLGSSILAPVDHDGDGLPEILVGTPSSALLGAWLAPGELEGDASADDALWSLDPEGDAGAAVLGADFDGDGYEDLMVGRPGATLGTAYIAMGPVGGQDSVHDLVEIRGSTKGGWGSTLAALDLDGDGAAEPLLAGATAQSSTGDETGCVAIAWDLSFTSTAPQTQRSSSAGLSCGSYTGDGYGASLVGQVVDGQAQLFVGASGSEAVWLVSVDPAY